MAYRYKNNVDKYQAPIHQQGYLSDPPPILETDLRSLEGDVATAYKDIEEATVSITPEDAQDAYGKIDEAVAWQQANSPYTTIGVFHGGEEAIIDIPLSIGVYQEIAESMPQIHMNWFPEENRWLLGYSEISEAGEGYGSGFDTDAKKDYLNQFVDKIKERAKTDLQTYYEGLGGYSTPEAARDAIASLETGRLPTDIEKANMRLNLEKTAQPITDARSDREGVLAGVQHLYGGLTDGES